MNISKQNLPVYFTRHRATEVAEKESWTTWVTATWCRGRR